jgi:hypothetical protein
LVDKYGVDPGVLSEDGTTPIVVAAKAEQFEAVELLKYKYNQTEPTPEELEALANEQ